MQILSPQFKIPANASRFFENYSEAVVQPLGEVQLVWDYDNRIIVNQAYSPGLIKFDSQYCTSVSTLGATYSIPTLTYFGQVLQYIKQSPLVIDIGCGQGEFVFELRNRGIEALGFDPVLRSVSPYLFRMYWERSFKSADLYVMRCVLPHIQFPWNFLSEISTSAPNALVLIEFQRIEWILENQLWYSVSHDHVNLFSINDFRYRFRDVFKWRMGVGFNLSIGFRHPQERNREKTRKRERERERAF